MSPLLCVYWSYVSAISSIDAYIRIENNMDGVVFYIGVLGQRGLRVSYS